MEVDTIVYSYTRRVHEVWTCDVSRYAAMQRALSRHHPKCCLRFLSRPLSRLVKVFIHLVPCRYDSKLRNRAPAKESILEIVKNQTAHIRAENPEKIQLTRLKMILNGSHDIPPSSGVVVLF
jgi:hypothetical protein